MKVSKHYIVDYDASHFPYEDIVPEDSADVTAEERITTDGKTDEKSASTDKKSLGIKPCLLKVSFF